jgi:hypothetical protein
MKLEGLVSMVAIKENCDALFIAWCTVIEGWSLRKGHTITWWQYQIEKMPYISRQISLSSHMLKN